MTFDLQNTRRDLVAMRNKHGKDSPIGHRCSMLIEQLKNLKSVESEDQRKSLTASIQRTMDSLAKLTGKGE